MYVNKTIPTSKKQINDHYIKDEFINGCAQEMATRRFFTYFSLFALEKSKHLACPVHASCMHNELLHRVFKALKHNAKCKMFVSTLSISEAGSSVHLI